MINTKLAPVIHKQHHVAAPKVKQFPQFFPVAPWFQTFTHFPMRNAIQPDVHRDATYLGYLCF